MINVIYHYTCGEKLYNKMVSFVCEKYDLTYMEFTVVMFLANNPQYDTATEIVNYRHLTKSHVSMTIRRLQEKKMLTGEYRGENRRTLHLKLTDKTSDIVKDGRQAQQAFRDLLTEGFTEEEKELLFKFVDKVDENIKKHSNSIKQVKI